MVFVLIAGIPSSLGFGIWSHITPLGMDLLDFFDFVSNTVMMPIVSFLICFLAAYILKPDTIIKEAQANGASFKSEKFYRIMIRYVAPIGIIAIWVSSMAAGLGSVFVVIYLSFPWKKRPSMPGPTWEPEKGSCWQMVIGTPGVMAKTSSARC